jgi:hypothetical protein
MVGTEVYFYAPQKREHIIVGAALSVCLTIRFIPEHKLKTLGQNFLKLHTLVEGIKAECSAKES